MKKNLKKLVLNKSTLSNLENEKVVGGLPKTTTVVVNPTKTQLSGCDLSYPNQNCTQNSACNRC
jgi:hypothetical protein